MLPIWTPSFPNSVWERTCFSKLCFPFLGNRVAGDIGVPKQSLGTRLKGFLDSFLFRRVLERLFDIELFYFLQDGRVVRGFENARVLQDFENSPFAN